MRRRAPACLALLCGLCIATGPAAAVDAVRAEPPVAVPDGTLRIGLRTLHLPPGDWLLVGQRVRSLMVTPRQIDGVDAWLVRLDRGRFNLAIHVSLPTVDGSGVHEWGQDPCASDDNILRQDLSRGLTLPECLAIVGHRDMQAALVGLAPGVQRWLETRHLLVAGPVVQFAYRERASGTYGAVSLYFAAECFPGDDDARQWARGLRDAFQPFFEGRQLDADLPPGPTADGACHAPPATATPAPG
ncbi:MAG: hypothetical protein ABJD97_18205 [Betaproteobacteria bacterium]